MVSAITFMFIFVAGCLAALFIDAYYGVCLYVLEYFLNPPGRWWGGHLPNLRYAFSIAAITVASFLLRNKRYSGNRVFDVPQFKWLVFLGIIIIGTWPIAVDQKEHEQFMTIFIKYVFFYYIIIKTVDTPEIFNKLIGAFLAGQFYLGWIIYEVGRTAEGRVEGMGTADAKNANGLAAVLVVAVPILLHYLITGKKWQRFCSLPAIAFVMNALILINSRGAFIAILISMTYYLLLILKAPSVPKFSKAQVLAGIAVGFLVFIYLADQIFWGRMSSITATPENEEVYTGRERIDFWFLTFDMLEDHPYGVGAMGYEKLSPIYLPPDALSAATKTRAVHSTYFEVLSEYGYHGFIIFIFFLLSNIRYLWKLKKSLLLKKFHGPYYLAIAIEAGFIAHLVAAVFINRFYSEVLYWSSAFIAAYGNIYFKKLNQQEDAAVPGVVAS